MKLVKPVQKAKDVATQNNARFKESNAFAEAEFQSLQRRKLNIPVKLFHL